MKNKLHKLFYVIASMMMTLGQIHWTTNVFAETTPKIAGDDPGVTLTAPKEITSRQLVELDVTLSGSAGKLNEDGVIGIAIPKSIVPNVNDFKNNLVLHSPFSLANPSVTEDGQGNYVFHVSYDSNQIDQNSAFGATFTVKFTAPYMDKNNTDIPDSVRFEASLTKGGAVVSTDEATSTIVKSTSTLPLLRKWSTRPTKVVNGTNASIMSLSDPSANIFAISVNYSQQSVKNAKIVDTMPEGMTLADPDRYLPVTGDGTPIQHLRIAKVTSRATDGSPTAWEYVTSQFSTKITTTDRTFTVDFGNLTPDDSYVIMYGQKVEEGLNPDNFGVRNNHVELQSNDVMIRYFDVPVALDDSAYKAVTLTKAVEQSNLSTKTGEIEYSLTLKSESGVVKAGTVITDPLPETLTYQTTTAKDSSVISDVSYDSANRVMKYTLLKDLPEGASTQVKFTVQYDNPNGQPNDTIVNRAYITYAGTNIYSNSSTMTLGGSATLTKVDTETKQPLANAVFKVVDEQGTTVLDQLVTDGNGVIDTGTLGVGNYQFIEVKAPTGYQLDATPVPFTISPNQTTPVQVTKENQVVTGSVVLSKVDSESKKELSGAVFELQSADGTVIQSDLTTNNQGKVIVSNLKAGNYQFVETQAPVGYELDSTPVTFEIKKGESVAVQVIKENTLIKGGVVLTKEDAEDGHILPGAVFELQDNKGNILQTGLTTNESGRLEVNDLVPGHYQLVETESPTGYEKDSTPIPFTVEKGKQDSVQLTKKNKVVPGSVLLTKVDSETGKTLAGAVFELQDKDGHTLQENLVTDNFGHLSIAGLKVGHYQLVETQAPKGYEIDTTPIKFEITKDMSHKNVEVTKENTPEEKSVRLEKRDRQTEQLLSGAEFELRNEDGKVLQSGLVTDKNGVIFLKGLANGNYQLIETKAPNGYRLDATPVVFTVDSSTTVVNVTKYNVKETQDAPVNPTNKNDGTPIKNNLSNSGKYTIPIAKYNQTNNPQEKKSSVNGKRTYLPKTGEKTNKWLIWIGGGILLVVSFGIFALKKKKSPIQTIDDRDR